MASAWAFLSHARALRGVQSEFGGNVARVQRATDLVDAGGGDFLRAVARRAAAGRMARSGDASRLFVGGFDTDFDDAVVRAVAARHCGGLGAVWTGALRVRIA